MLKSQIWKGNLKGTSQLPLLNPSCKVHPYTPPQLMLGAQVLFSPVFSCTQSCSTQTYSLPTALFTTQRDEHNIHIADAGGVHTTVSSPPPLIPAQSLTCVYLGPPTPTVVTSPPSQTVGNQLGSENHLVLTHLFGWYSSLETYHDVMDAREKFENRRLLSPPDDIVLGHKQYIHFQNPCSGKFEQTKEKRNVYYHPWKTCTTPHFLNFDPVHHITIVNYAKEKLCFPDTLTLCEGSLVFPSRWLSLTRA